MYRDGIVFVALSMMSLELMAGSLMYVPMGNANDIAIIDLETDSVVARIDELENAHGLSASPNSEYLVAGSMKSMEADTSSNPDKPAAVSEAEHAAHHSGGESPSSAKESYLSIVHPKHGHVMRRIAVRGLTHHTAVSPDGKFAVAVHSGNGGISVVNIASMSVVKTVDTGQWPNYAVFTNDGSRLYVSNAGENSISEIDTHSWKVVRELKAGKEPEHIVLGKKEQILYTANKGGATISSIDLKSGHIKHTYDVGNNPHGIDVSDDGRWLFVVSNEDGVVTQINLANGEYKTVELKPAPYHLTYINGQRKVYVSSRKEPKIWELDPDTLAVKSTIDLGLGVAHQMVIRDE